MNVLRNGARSPFEPSINFQEKTMALLLLEALGALLLLVFIVWWTMFSGRKKGELRDRPADGTPDTEKEKK